MKNFDEIYHAIMNCSREDLDLVIDAVKVKDRRLREEATETLSVGDFVQFDAGRRGTIRGEVTKINPKTVMVRQTGKGTNWKIHDPSVLKLSLVA